MTRHASASRGDDARRPFASKSTANSSPAFDRRALLVGGLAWGGLAASALAARNAFAPGVASSLLDDFPIPADKGLDPDWVRSLSARGEPTVYTSARNELRFIGMPIGGITTGQVYLGGDGVPWHWDVFNLAPTKEWAECSGGHYKTPATPTAPFPYGFQVFAASGNETWSRSIDAKGFADVRFRGQYPVAFVDYADPGCPLAVGLEAFSPFIPLWTDDSSLPAIVMEFTIENTSKRTVALEFMGWMENLASIATLPQSEGRRRNRVSRPEGYTIVSGDVVAAPAKPKDPARRPDILFEDFEKETYIGWTATGTAFGRGPRRVSELPGYMGPVDAHGERTVNTHETRNGEDVVQADTHIGTLTSRAFTIERDFVSLRVGGGKHPGQTCVNVLVDGAPVRSVTGRDANRMHVENLDVRDWAGKQAQIQIVDASTGGWGQIGVDEIVFCDEPRRDAVVLEQAPDWGTMALALFTPKGSAQGSANIAPAGGPAERASRPLGTDEPRESTASSAEHLVGAISTKATLSPRAKLTLTFVLAWRFDGLWRDSLRFIPDVEKLRRHYGTRFEDAAAVVRYVAEKRDFLFEGTRTWREVFYDRSTLPHWFLERTLANASTLATSTAYRFSNGRFYGWEGCYSCAGTCTHVWQYAQAVARLFPDLERDLRERTDYGTSFHAGTGLIDYRGEAARALAIDGQLGVVLRTLREHQMSADDAFLRRLWPRVRKSLEFVIARDVNQDGILDGEQYNTLDASWWGAIAWISSLYIAALRAGEAMASEMGDASFAAKCRALAESGSKQMVARLYDGEYFIQIPDPAHPEANSTGTGCHIDQLLGESFARQIALPRVVPEANAKSALRSLWKYAFTRDIGPYRARFDTVLEGGRWYAFPGEGGMLMCTWPKGGIESATGKGKEAWAAGYFEECMSGFEHQVAGHMLREGLVLEGLAVERTIHERYHASKRNPWNEIECGDHYSRAMASYGVYLAACGYEHHGPRRHLGFAPKLTPEDFRCAFTVAEGWGSFAQARDLKRQIAKIEITWGRLWLRTFALECPESLALTKVEARFEPALPAQEGDHAQGFTRSGTRVLVTFAEDLDLTPGQALVVTLS